jgi:hypothetical protein
MKTILATTAATWLALAPGQAALAQTASQSIDSQAATPAPTDQPGDSAMELAKKDRQKYLEQGANLTQIIEFYPDDTPARLVGKGSVSLDSGLSGVNPGGGAFVEVYFTTPADPVFLQCTDLLKAGKGVSVFGHGSYELGQEVGDPVILRLNSLTKCQRM